MMVETPIWLLGGKTDKLGVGLFDLLCPNLSSAHRFSVVKEMGKVQKWSKQQKSLARRLSGPQI